jgi:hypothetical protein
MNCRRVILSFSRFITMPLPKAVVMEMNRAMFHIQSNPDIPPQQGSTNRSNRALQL